jgi:hypothetical protein
VSREHRKHLCELPLRPFHITIVHPRKMYTFVDVHSQNVEENSLFALSAQSKLRKMAHHDEDERKKANKNETKPKIEERKGKIP